MGFFQSSLNFIFAQNLLVMHSFRKGLDNIIDFDSIDKWIFETVPEQALGYLLGLILVSCMNKDVLKSVFEDSSYWIDVVLEVKYQYLISFLKSVNWSFGWDLSWLFTRVNLLRFFFV